MTDSTFFNDVYDVVRLIPKGRVSSYGAIARYLGTARSSRLVGYAMNGAAGQKDIPAHRVVNRSGLLTGKHHFKTPHEMERLLRREGVKVENDRVVNFREVFWDPMQELEL